MVADSISPFYHFCIIAVADIGIMLLARGSMLPRDNAAPKPADAKQRVFSRPDRYIVVLGVIAFCSMICEGTMFDWSGIYFEQVVRPGKELVRLGFVAFMTTMTLGRLTADRIIIRYGAINVLKVCGLLIASGLLLSVLFPNLVAATAGFLLVGLGTSAIVPLCYSMAGKSTTMMPGIAIATVSTIGFLGFLLGPPLIGYIAHALSLRWSLGIIAAIGLSTTFVASQVKVSYRLKNKS
jgi:MFS family permease